MAQMFGAFPIQGTGINPEAYALLMQRQQADGQNPTDAVTVPAVQEQMKLDPRTQIANSLMAQGGSTAPVAQGKWAFADGIARALGGAAGGYIGRQQQKKYAGDQSRMQAALAGAMGNMGQPAAVAAQQAQAATPPQGDPTGAIAGALAAPPGGMGGFTPQGGAGGPQAPFPASSGPVSSRRMTPTASQPSGPASGSRAQRNNNPGNLRASPWTRKQPGFVGTDDAGFAVFDSPEAGANGQAALLRSYMSRGYDTVSKIINRWAPRTDGNDTSAYVNMVANTLGVDPNAKLTRANIPALQQIISRVEGGPGGTPVRAANVQQASAGAETGAQPVQAAATPQFDNPIERPQAPGLPDKPQSRAAQLARSFIDSGNPYLLALGMEYMQQGTKEEYDANRLAAEQQFQQGQTGYQGDISRYNTGVANAQQGSISAGLETQAFGNRRALQDDEQAFTGGQNAANRALQASEGAADRALRRDLAAADNEAALERARLAAGTKADRYYMTDAGIKDRNATYDKMNKADEQIASANRVVDLVNQINTGGFEGSSIPTNMRKNYNSSVAELQALHKQLVLDKMGGSLGVAISDGDRRFVENMVPIGPGYPRANNLRAAAQLSILAQRDKDFAMANLTARADNRVGELDKEWVQYKKDVPLFDRSGMPRPYVSYEDWRAKRKEAQ